MIEDIIIEFVNYGLNKNLIENDDVIYITNSILGILNLKAIKKSFTRCTATRSIDEILEDLINYARDNKIIGEYLYERDLFDTLLMDKYTPKPSDVIKEFSRLYKQSPGKATDYFFKLMCDVNYVRCGRIAKNICYSSPSKYGDIEITINLSKPEKDPKAIALALTNKDNNEKYPKCAICYENIGYFGNESAQARNNLRAIPLRLNDEQFYFQYSPYAYYNEHCIIFKSTHEPMKINHNTFARLLDFVDAFPDYFLGSNADLPIVGGSILTHEHYQGGKYEFPLDKADIRYSTTINDIKISYLNWPLDCLRLESTDKQNIIKMADNILDKWRSYSNPTINIIAKNGEPHNTITPIARKRGATYILNLVLRNNLTNNEYPFGLYHPDESLHHIKKENIGLIEVMGLAILPARLKKELALIKDILAGRESESRLTEVEAHREWFNELKKLDSPNVDLEVGKIFVKVLEACGVFKFGNKNDVINFITSLK